MNICCRITELPQCQCELRIDDFRPRIVVFEVCGVPLAVVVVRTSVSILESFVKPADAVSAHKCVFHIPHETLSRQYAVNGDLLYEPFFLVPVSYRHRDFDKFFLYRRKIGVKVQAFLCGAAFFIRCADFLFYVFGNLSDKFFIHTITSK